MRSGQPIFLSLQLPLPHQVIYSAFQSLLYANFVPSASFFQQRVNCLSFARVRPLAPHRPVPPPVFLIFCFRRPSKSQRPLVVLHQLLPAPADRGADSPGADELVRLVVPEFDSEGVGDGEGGAGEEGAVGGEGEGLGEVDVVAADAEVGGGVAAGSRGQLDVRQHCLHSNLNNLRSSITNH